MASGPCFTFSDAQLAAESVESLGKMLFESTAGGNLALLTSLLRSGRVDPNAFDPSPTRRYGKNVRPLHLACGAIGAVHPDCARALLAHGASPDEADQTGALPLHHAAYAGASDLVEALLAGHAARGSVETALATRSVVMGSPLMHAVVNGALDPVQRLLEAGAPWEDRAFDEARRRDNAAVVGALEERRLAGQLPPAPKAARPVRL